MTPTPTPTQTVTPTISPSLSVSLTPSQTPTAPLPDPNVYFVASNGIVRKLGSDASRTWTNNLNASPNTCIAIDQNGFIYVGSSNHTIKKVDSGGNVSWTYAASNDVVSVAVDPSGNVIIGTFGGKVIKLDSDGTFLWEYAVGSFVRAVETDFNSYVYFGADDGKVRKLTPTGDLLWLYEGHSEPILTLEIDYKNNVYSGSRDNTVHKISNDGVFIWKYEGHTSDVNAIFVDNNEILYTASSDGTAHKVSKGAKLIWAYTNIFPRKILDVSVDINHNVYLTSNDGRLIKLDGDGSSDITARSLTPTIIKIWEVGLTGISITGVSSSPKAGVFPEEWGRASVPSTTLTPTPTATSTVTPTPTATSTVTPTLTPTSTATPTFTPTLTPTMTLTPTSTITPTAALTSTPVVTPTYTQTATPTPTLTPTPTASSTINGIDDVISTLLVPTHRWRLDEASPATTLADTGSGTALDVSLVSGTIAGYEQGGPDASTESINFGASSVLNNASSLSNASTGSVLFFWYGNNLANSTVVVGKTNSVNEFNTFVFGNNPQSVSTSNRLACTMTTTSFFNRRTWEGSTDVSGLATDSFHLAVFTKDGSGIRIYLDGVEETVSEITNGTAPDSISWFDTVDDANSRTVITNARYLTGSSSFVGRASEICVFDSNVLTPSEISTLWSYVTN